MKKTELDKRKLFTDTGFKVAMRNGKLGSMKDQFLVAPFSVLRTADLNWVARKSQWVRLGIVGELGRGGQLLTKNENTPLLNTSEGEKWKPNGKALWQNSGTSIFDPVLCELMYSWFCVSGGQIIDPFAGGSVRGVIAAYMGYKYFGVDLREEQIVENIKQGELIVPNNQPMWLCGDSTVKIVEAPKADFIFSCPPYGNLEVYSDLEDDISNKDYSVFLEMYGVIIKNTCARLKQNRFACFVVSNFRDQKTGFYYDLVGDTVRAFETAGLHYYNEGILLPSLGSLYLRTSRQFNASRKFGKAHQNILIFYKGDSKKIKTIFGVV